MTNNKKLLIGYLPIIVLLILIDIIIGISAGGHGYDAEGNFVKAHSYEMKRAIIVTCVFTFQFIGFVIGLVISLFLHKGLKYSQKYLKASLISIIGLHSICILISIYNIFFR